MILGKGVFLLQIRMPSKSYQRAHRLAEEHELSLNRLVLRSLRHFERCKVIEDKSEEQAKTKKGGDS